jgi:hypothetical protein
MGGLRFEAYLPPGLANWLLEQIEQGVFSDPGAAVVAIFDEHRELAANADLRHQLLRRTAQAAIDDPGLSLSDQRVEKRLGELVDVPSRNRPCGGKGHDRLAGADRRKLGSSLAWPFHVPLRLILFAIGAAVFGVVVGRLIVNLWRLTLPVIIFTLVTREAKIGAHTFRATGITAYLKNKGTLEHAQTIANHASPRTTKLYDRRSNEIALDEVEKIAI